MKVLVGAFNQETINRFAALVQGRVSNECAVPGILSRQEAVKMMMSVAL